MTLQPRLFFHLQVLPERGLAEQRDEGERSEYCCKRVKVGMTFFLNMFKAGWRKGKQTGLGGLKQSSLIAHQY